MGRYFGIAAVDLIIQENFGRMVSFQNGQITSVPIVDIVGKIQTVDVKTLYDTERLNGRRSILNLPG
jgi:6-phosphofructokinase 1